MNRTLAAALAISLVGTVTADAAKRQKRHFRAVHAAPIAMQQIYPNRPIWAAPGQCFSDEGYGRFTPCDVGGRGR